MKEATSRRPSAGRANVWHAISTSGPVSVADISARTGLHENTVRGHIQQLAAQGYISRIETARSGRGRPSHHWIAVPIERRSAHWGLAISLIEALEHAPNAAMIARQAGHAWGARFAEESKGHETARQHVAAVMEDQGFAPQRDDDGGMLLTQCPLLSAVRESELVCAVHEAFIEGIARHHSPTASAKLEPFAADGACRLHLQVADRA